MIKRNLLSLLFVCSALFFRAQETAAPAPAMADAFRDNGKIYVVISVIAIVFVCIVAFLIYLERQLKKLEKQVKKD